MTTNVVLGCIFLLFLTMAMCARIVLYESGPIDESEERIEDNGTADASESESV